MARDSDIAIRKPPYKAVLALHLPRLRGKCQWCGEPTEERIESGKLRFWHQACEDAFDIIVFPAKARLAVYRRDKAVCCDCHEKAGFDDKLFQDAWHVDHNIPLWKVSHMEPLQRIEYFKLHNLVTRCHGCHKVKSAKESSERAHGRNVRGENKEAPKRAWPSRKIDQPKDPWGKAFRARQRT